MKGSFPQHRRRKRWFQFTLILTMMGHSESRINCRGIDYIHQAFAISEGETMKNAYVHTRACMSGDTMRICRRQNMLSMCIPLPPPPTTTKKMHENITNDIFSWVLRKPIPLIFCQKVFLYALCKIFFASFMSLLMCIYLFTWPLLSGYVITYCTYNTS